MNIELAVSIALEAHKGQKDKAGKPYILHPLRLMSKFDREDLQIIAVLHDVVEDSHITLDKLNRYEFHPRIITAVGRLTHRLHETYPEYIERVSGNDLATQVKLEDLRDNMDVIRLGGDYPWCMDDFRRLKKYAIAYERLKNGVTRD